jgi:calcium/calmodulin-dependent protein kinase I
MANVIAEAIPTDILDEYDVDETLGTGHFSKVKLGTDKKTGAKVAIKVIKKPSGSKVKMLKAEVDILTKCDHPNIVKMHRCFETDTILYLVLELLTGGELFDRIISKGHYSEADARKVTITLLDAIKYLHSQGIAHRDLKPENILLSDKTDSASIKVTDFGLSKIFADDAAAEVVMKTACGTPGYVAPEVLAHEAYSSQVDLWSVGVIVYILLCGFPPFYGDNDAQLFKRIKSGTYKFLAPYWDPISPEAKDFVKNLLIVDPRKRMTAAEALNHKWLARRTAPSTKNLFAPNGAEKDAAAKGGASGGTASRPGSALSDSTPKGMAVQMTQFNVERKAGRADKLIKAFNLPPDSKRFGKYMASLGGAFGQLHVTSQHLCFLGALGKRVCVALSDVISVTKAKRFRLTPGKGHSLHVSTKQGASYEFHGIPERDACAAVLVGQCKAGGGNPTVVDKTR